jgi:hypothetical protein
VLVYDRTLLRRLYNDLIQLVRCPDFREDAEFFALFGVQADPAPLQRAPPALSPPRRQPSPKKWSPPRRQYPNWEEAFDDEKTLDAPVKSKEYKESRNSEAENGRGRSKEKKSEEKKSTREAPAPVRVSEPEPKSKIDEYADAFEQFEKGKLQRSRLRRFGCSQLF